MPCAEEKLLARNPDMEEDFLYRKLRLIAVLGFMHDIDKDLNLGGRIQSVEDVNDEPRADGEVQKDLPVSLPDLDPAPEQPVGAVGGCCDHRGQGYEVQQQQARAREPPMNPAYWSATASQATGIKAIPI